LNFPGSIAADEGGNVFVTDAANSEFSANTRIQKFDSVGTFLTKWGRPAVGGVGDGIFSTVSGVAVDRSGNVFITDAGGSVGLNGRPSIQEFTNTGMFLQKFGCEGIGEGQLDAPIGLGVDGNTNVFVADTYNRRVQKFACP